MNQYYISKKELSLTVGITSFTLPSNSFISVVQEDNAFRKVLVRFGSGLIGWKSKYFLNDFKRVN